MEEERTLLDIIFTTNTPFALTKRVNFTWVDFIGPDRDIAHEFREPFGVGYFPAAPA